jgi:hypothetical protein
MICFPVLSACGERFTVLHSAFLYKSEPDRFAWPNWETVGTLSNICTHADSVSEEG